MKDSPFDELPVISHELKAADEIPLLGNSPPFPLEEVSKQIAILFDREDLHVACEVPMWRSSENLMEGLGDDLTVLNILFPTLKGQVCVVIPKEEISVLTALLLTKDIYPLPIFDADLNESFYRFFAGEVLYHLANLSVMKNFSPIITQQTTPIQEDALCIDLSLQVNEHVVRCRLMISQDFRKSWVTYFSHHKDECHSSEVIKKAPVILRIKAGETELSLSEWKRLKLGDILVLDSCSLKGEHFEGRVILVYEDKWVLRAKLKDGTLKILELPLAHEVKTPMAKQQENEFEDEFTDLDFLDESTLDEPEKSVLDEKEEALVTEDVEKITDQEEPLAAEGTEKIVDESVNKEKETHSSSNREIISPEKIPLSVVIELGRISIAVETLLKLEPGNFLEAEIHPENGVDLTINGQIVGRGELVRLGEAVGVRILELGKHGV